MNDRSIDRSLVFLGQQQSSKTGGSAKQANKENGDAVVDEVSGKFPFRHVKSFAVRIESHFRWILFAGMGVDVFKELFFQTKLHVLFCFISACRLNQSLSQLHILRAKLSN